MHGITRSKNLKNSCLLLAGSKLLQAIRLLLLGRSFHSQDGDQVVFRAIRHATTWFYVSTNTYMLWIEEAR